MEIPSYYNRPCLINPIDFLMDRIHINNYQWKRWTVAPLEELASSIAISTVSEKTFTSFLSTLTCQPIWAQLLISSVKSNNKAKFASLLKLWPWNNITLAPCRMFPYMEFPGRVDPIQALVELFIDTIITVPLNNLRILDVSAFALLRARRIIRRLVTRCGSSNMGSYKKTGSTYTQESTDVNNSNAKIYVVKIQDILMAVHQCLGVGLSSFANMLRALDARRYYSYQFKNGDSIELTTCRLSLTIEPTLLQQVSNCSDSDLAVLHSMQAIKLRLLQKKNTNQAIASFVCTFLTMFRNVVSLTLFKWKLEDYKLPVLLNKLPRNLDTLQLQWYASSPPDFSSLCSCPQLRLLKSLSLNASDLGSHATDAVKLITGIKHSVEVLDISCCWLTKECFLPILDTILGCEELQYLDISSNLFSLEGVFADLCKMGILPKMVMVHVAFKEHNNSSKRDMLNGDVLNLEDAINDYRQQLHNSARIYVRCSAYKLK